MNTIAAFFVGIMAFVSGSFGYVSHQISPLLVVQVQQGNTSTSTIVMASTSATVVNTTTKARINNFKTFRSNNERGDFDLEIQYPEKWKVATKYDVLFLYDTVLKTKDHKNKMVFMIRLLDDGSWYPGNGNDIYINSKSSFEMFVKSNFIDKNNPEQPKKIFIDGYEAWELPSEKSIDACYKWTLLYRNGLVFEIYRNTDTCMYDSAALDSVISSIHFFDQATTTNEFFLGRWHNGFDRGESSSGSDSTSVSDENIPVKIIAEEDSVSVVQHLIRGDIKTTIKRDFSGPPLRYFYTSKDKNRIFFELLSEKDFAPPCNQFYYFDIKYKRYIHPNLKTCNQTVVYVGGNDKYGNRIEKEREDPIIIQEGKFNYKDLYILNLESVKENLVYSRKNNSESLISSCANISYGDYGENSEYASDIERLPNNKIRVGVYKEVGQDTQPCTEKTLGKYEKIRDDIIDLNKL